MVQVEADMCPLPRGVLKLNAVLRENPGSPFVLLGQTI